MNYPPLKFTPKGGPLDGENWILGKAKPENAIRDGLQFNLIRRNPDKTPYSINAKYSVRYDEQSKSYEVTYIEPNG